MRMRGQKIRVHRAIAAVGLISAGKYMACVLGQLLLLGQKLLLLCLDHLQLFLQSELLNHQVGQLALRSSMGNVDVFRIVLPSRSWHYDGIIRAFTVCT